MPKEDSDDEDIWDYQPRHRTKQSQHSKDACVVRNDVQDTRYKIQESLFYVGYI